MVHVAARHSITAAGTSPYNGVCRPPIPVKRGVASHEFATSLLLAQKHMPGSKHDGRCSDKGCTCAQQRTVSAPGHDPSSKKYGRHTMVRRVSCLDKTEDLHPPEEWDERDTACMISFSCRNAEPSYT